MTAAIALLVFSVIIIGLIGFWIKTILDIADTNFADTSHRILWILFVFFFPVVGICCWYVFGRKNARAHWTESY